VSQQTDIILPYLLISAGIISVLSFFIILFIFAYQRKMTKKQLEFDAIEANYQRDLFNSVMQAKEQEKKRISEELHDDIGSRLNALRMMLKKKELADLEEIDGQLVQISKRVRVLSNELIPSTLQATGLMRSLRELISGIDRTGALSASCQIELLDNIHYSDEINLSIYRIVQELLNNIIKHAYATAVQLSAHMSSEELIIELVDNGSGFQPTRANLTSKQDNLGLKNIASRSQYIDARIQFELIQPKGTKVKIRLKLP
jgi:signal transduction histidine kinase